MSYRGMISDADLMETIFDLSFNNATDLKERRRITDEWGAQGNKSLDRRIDAFWADFEEALGQKLDAAVELERPKQRQRLYDAQVKAAEQVVLGSVTQDVSAYLFQLGTRANVHYSTEIRQTESGIMITVKASGAFGSAARTAATNRDERFLTGKLNEGRISFDHTPSIGIDRYGLTILPLENTQTASARNSTHSFQITYHALVPTGMLGGIYDMHHKQ